MAYTHNAYLEFRNPEKSGNLSKKTWWSNAIYTRNCFWNFQYITQKNRWGRFQHLTPELKALSRFDNQSRIYISAHCTEKSELIYDDSSGSMSYSLLAKILASLLTHPSLKNNHEPFLKISLISCLAAVGSPEKQHEDSFAALLQKELGVKYGIYVEIVARSALVRVSLEGDHKYTDDESRHREHLEVKKLAEVKIAELREINQKIVEYREKPLNMRNNDMLRYFNPLIQLTRDAAKVEEKIKEISNTINQFILHRQAGTKFSYKWRADRSRIRRDVYAENDTKIWRKKLYKILIVNVNSIPTELRFFAQKVNFADIGDVVDDLSSILHKYNNLDLIIFKSLNEIYNEICAMTSYLKRQPTIILPRLIP